MGSQIIHLKYDVVRAQGTHVLDEMDEVHEVNCTSTSLSIEITPESDFDIASRQFQLGNVIAGGKEWGCQSGELGAPAAAAAFTRRVESVLIDHPPRIVLITSDCSPFEAFERQDIDIWSEDVVHSGNDLRSHKSTLQTEAGKSEGNLSTRYFFETDLIDQDQQWTGTKVLSNEYFLLGGVSGANSCRCGDYSKRSGPRNDPSSVKACQDKSGCLWVAGTFYGGTCSGVCTQASITGSVSLLYQVSFQANFRFRIRAGTNRWGALTLKELEFWVDETLTFSSKIKASVNAFFSVSRADTLAENQQLIAVPTSVGGIGAQLGLFGELVAKMEANIEGQFNAEAGIISSRRKKYGGWWDTSQPGWITSGTMVPINEDFPPTKDKYFTWGGKVVAKVQASLELKTSFKIGLGFGSVGSLGLELSSGLGLGLIAEFKYALGNIILQPVVTTRFFIKENDAICQQQHQTEAHLIAVMTALDIIMKVNPFYHGTLRKATTLLDIPLFIGCWASGGVAGQTQDYERIAGGSSNTFQQVESYYVAPAPAPTPKPACIVGIDCPVQPGACANGYAGTSIGHPCASGCAIGFGYDQQCQPSTCCRANAASPPANGEHKIVGEGSWTNQALTVPGGKYTEVRCNAGYTLSGRNLGFQLLGTWPNCAGSCTSSCCYSLATNHNQRPWDWPDDSSYTACVTESTSSGGRRSYEVRSRVSGHQQGLNKSSDVMHARTAGRRQQWGGSSMSTCRYENDGNCDEPDGVTAKRDPFSGEYCKYGTDQADCGSCRLRASCKNSCRYATDGYCDEPNTCLTGTDTSDCVSSSPPAPPPPPPPPPPTGSTGGTDSTTTVTCAHTQSSSCSCSPSSGQSSGTITDGSGDYSPAQDCRWLISSTTTIRLSFNSFGTEANYDFVTINSCTSSSCGTKTQLAYLSGSVVPSAEYTSSTGYLQVLFTSDSSDNGAGFEATWQVGTSSGSTTGGTTTGGSPPPPPPPPTTAAMQECKFRQSIPADGSWKLEERSCNPISCGVYPAPAYGTVSPLSVRTYGQTVTITCNTGYELTGDARASATPSCQANGQFTTGKQCARKACAPFSAIPNGAAFPDTGVLSGQRAVVSCYDGYELAGDVSLLCDRGAYQITTYPSCRQISCGLLSVQNGLSTLQTPILFGNTTEIRCNPGYTFSSQTMTAECRADGAFVCALCNL
jgi:hypothetical protein